MAGGMLPLDEPLDMEGRAALLPFRDTLPGSVMNKRSWALPGMLAGAWNAFTAPGRAARGMLDPQSPEAMEEALNVAGYPMLAGAGSAMAGARAMPQGMLGVNVFHGSPHKFKKFDASKIGTGEGAQVYGHGLYLAENPGVAKSHIPKAAHNDTVRKFLKQLPEDAGFDEVIGLVGKGHFTPEQDAVLLALQKNDWLGFDYPSQAISQAYHGLRNFPDASPELVNAVKTSGHLYKVDLPDEMAAKMLYWDKPLSQQPENVRTAIAALLGERFSGVKPIDGMPLSGGGRLRVTEDPDFGPQYRLAFDDGQSFKLNRGDVANLIGTGVEGKAVHQALREKLGSDLAVAQALREAGIPGVRYLDQGSRTAGKGTSNYVVFPGEEAALKILGRE